MIAFSNLQEDFGDGDVLSFSSPSISYSMKHFEDKRYHTPIGKDFFRSLRFSQMMSGITQKNLVQHSAGKLGLGEQTRIPFIVSSHDREADVLLLSPHPSLFDFYLISPDGREFRPEELPRDCGLYFAERRYGLCFRMDLVRWADRMGITAEGQWLAVMRFDRSKMQEPRTQRNRKRLMQFLDMRRFKAEFGLMVQVRSSLQMSTFVRQTREETGKVIHLGVLLSDTPGLEDCSMQVSAELCAPGAVLKRIAFLPGKDGVHEARWVVLAPGIHSFRITVEFLRDGKLVAMRECLVGTSVEVSEGGGMLPFRMLQGNLHGAGFSMTDFMELIHQYGLEEMISLMDSDLKQWDFEKEALPPSTREPRLQVKELQLGMV